MAIPVQRESVHELKRWGIGLEKLIEVCVFCDQPTRFWNTKSNTPVCPDCGLDHTVADIGPARAAACAKKSRNARSAGVSV